MAQCYQLVWLCFFQQRNSKFIWKKNVAILCHNSTHLFFVEKIFISHQLKSICLNIDYFFADLVNRTFAARPKKVSMSKKPKGTNDRDVSNISNGGVSNNRPVAAVAPKQIVPQFKSQPNKSKYVRFSLYDTIIPKIKEKNNNQNAKNGISFSELYENTHWLNDYSENLATFQTEHKQNAVKVAAWHETAPELNETIDVGTASTIANVNATTAPKYIVKSSSGGFIEEVMIPAKKQKLASKGKCCLNRYALIGE